MANPFLIVLAGSDVSKGNMARKMLNLQVRPALQIGRLWKDVEYICYLWYIGKGLCRRGDFQC